MIDLPTARDHKGKYRLVVWCRACRLQRELSFKSLVDDGRGDSPVINLRFRCTNCGSRLTDAWCQVAICYAAEIGWLQPAGGLPGHQGGQQSEEQWAGFVGGDLSQRHGNRCPPV
jgi:hypothetical protein